VPLLGPIFQREFLTIPRRGRHYLSRVGYLLMLWVIGMTAWLSIMGWSNWPTLGETARFGPLLFRVLTYVQLLMFLFFAALSTASAVSQEKDRRTFILLLMTDLRDREIVLGKVLGSLLPIGLLLLASVPLLMFLVLLGGVSVHQVIQAVVVIGATALAAGSLGGLIGLWRDRTFQSLALTVLFLVLYLCLVRGLVVVPQLMGMATEENVLHLQEVMDPFLAMRSVQDPASLLDDHLASAYIFAGVMLAISLALNGWGMVKLRRWNPSGEPIMQRERPAEEHFSPTGEGAQAGRHPPAEARERDRTLAHAAPGKARRVGKNPILWREIFTRAYGRRPLLVKLAYFLVLGLICYSALSPLIQRNERTDYAAAFGLLPVGVLSLLLVAAQAATAITSERDTGALDLLLVTDLTPREFIFGKLGGICWNSKEYLVPPLILAGVYAWYGCLAEPPRGRPDRAALMNFTAFVCLAAALLIFQAFAMVLGIHVALRTHNSRLAVINVLSTIFFLSGGTLVCIALILISGHFEYQWSSFVLFLIAGVGGLWWVLNGSRPSSALTVASWLCPLGVLWTVLNMLIAKPGSTESADPLFPAVGIVLVFGFTIAAMLVPLVSEFDIALGRTTGPGE
jgi:ABC-type transport system involved in multi-copper enzyme maturation permease subunit